MRQRRRRLSSSRTRRSRTSRRRSAGFAGWHGAAVLPDRKESVRYTDACHQPTAVLLADEADEASTWLADTLYARRRSRPVCVAACCA